MGSFDVFLSILDWEDMLSSSTKQVALSVNANWNYVDHTWEGFTSCLLYSLVSSSGNSPLSWSMALFLFRPVRRLSVYWGLLIVTSHCCALFLAHGASIVMSATARQSSGIYFDGCNCINCPNNVSMRLLGKKL